MTEGEPVFLGADGKTTIKFDRKKHGNVDDDELPLYPFFINEAAYYEKKIAFGLVRKQFQTYDFPVNITAKNRSTSDE